MPRLPAFGSSLMTPCREESELKRVISKLCPGTISSDAFLHDYYMTLASLIGGWLSEQARLETSPVKNALLTTTKNLSEASAFLSGFETGLRTDIEITVTSRVQSLMALNPTVGSLESARKRISSFKRDADGISHTCLRRLTYRVVPISGAEKRSTGTICLLHSWRVSPRRPG